MSDRDPWTDDPFRINLEQQKKRAKDLLKALRAGDAGAISRFAQHHPKVGAGEPPAGLFRLSDAQLVIARELGAPSWPALKSHVSDLDRSREAMNSGQVSPDGDLRTLHVRCGIDLKGSLETAGFTGAFLEYSDPVCQGPVQDVPDLVSRRARFLTSAYGGWMGFSEAQSRARLEEEQAALAAASRDFERVVLWFEHDTYDQLILARCLAHFAEYGAPAVLELVEAGGFPGDVRFIGLGQLPPEALRLLWGRRRSVGADAIASGTQVWQALRSADPTALVRLARGGCDGLPFLPGAIIRHLGELPSVFNGTALTEHLVLARLDDGPTEAGRIYRDIMVDTEPLPWLGDLMFRFILESMLDVDEAVLDAGPESGDVPWPKRRMALTDLGRAVLKGERDYMALSPPERWVGGVRVAAAETVWRWDGEAERPVRR